MRRAAPALLALALFAPGCFDDVPSTIDLDADQVTVPMGTSTEIGVWVDGRELAPGDAFSWVVDRPGLVQIAVTEDGAHVRITGVAEGTAMIQLGFQLAVTELPATVVPAAP